MEIFDFSNPFVIAGWIVGVAAIIFLYGYYTGSSGASSGASLSDYWNAFISGIFPPAGL